MSYCGMPPLSLPAPRSWDRVYFPTPYLWCLFQDQVPRQLWVTLPLPTLLLSPYPGNTHHAVAVTHCSSGQDTAMAKITGSTVLSLFPDPHWESRFQCLSCWALSEFLICSISGSQSVVQASASPGNLLKKQILSSPQTYWLWSSGGGIQQSEFYQAFQVIQMHAEVWEPLY